jgi:hypothetical protein
VEGRFVLAACSFNGRATTVTYLTILQSISDWIRLNLGKVWAPKRILSDFELAVRSAVLRHFGGPFASCWTPYPH